MSALTEYIDDIVRKRAQHVAEKRMKPAWDRNNRILLNVYHAFFLEALCIEYNELIGQAHAQGFISGLSKNTITKSLKDFYEEIK